MDTGLVLDIAVEAIQVMVLIAAPVLGAALGTGLLIGILQAARGPKGGFKLARPSNEVMIGEIINAVERNMDATQCSGEGICNSGTKCIAHNFWIDFNDNVNEFLMTRSLEDVITQRRGSVEQMGKALIATG